MRRISAHMSYELGWGVVFQACEARNGPFGGDLRAKCAIFCFARLSPNTGMVGVASERFEPHGNAILYFVLKQDHASLASDCDRSKASYRIRELLLVCKGTGRRSIS